VQLRRGLGGQVIRLVLESAARLARLHPAARELRSGVEVRRGLRYARGEGASHQLDLYRPRGVSGTLPVLLYVHGGGFQILSKETHWAFAASFARAGFLVATINYRHAPRHPFPAALEDAASALLWVLENASVHGGDSERLAYAGESAGANLVLSLAIAGCWRRPESFARDIWDAVPRPAVVLPACGILQTSHPERFDADSREPAWVRDRITVVCRDYLSAPDAGDPDTHALADPLCFLESAPPPERPLPAICAICGTGDPIAEDTRRLAHALERFDVEAETPFYEGGHAFHARHWSPAARASWRDQLAFLAARVS